jgi:hypothetical protein
VVDDAGQRAGLVGLAAPAVGGSFGGAAEVVADGALGDAEGAGDLRVGLALLVEGDEGHEFLRTELARHGGALPGDRFGSPKESRAGAGTPRGTGPAGLVTLRVT